MDICMHGIKRLFVEGLPLSMAIRQSVPRSIRVGVCVVFLRTLFFIAALIALQLKRINLVHLICLCESLHTRTVTFLINWFCIIMYLLLFNTWTKVLPLINCWKIIKCRYYFICYLIWRTMDTHFAKKTLFDHAEDQRSPEDVQKQQHHQHHVKEIIAKKRFELVQRIHPCTLDQPVHTQFNKCNPKISHSFTSVA